MIRFWKTVLILVGFGALVLGMVSILDSVVHNDYSLTSVISIIGFTGCGLILLSVANQLKYAIMDYEIGR